MNYIVAITRIHETSPQAILASEDASMVLFCREALGEWEALYQIVPLEHGAGISELPQCFALSSEQQALLQASVGPFVTDCFDNARWWIAECDWANLDPEDIAELTNHEVRIGVSHHYDGGWTGFCEEYERSRVT